MSNHFKLFLYAVGIMSVTMGGYILSYGGNITATNKDAAVYIEEYKIIAAMACPTPRNRYKVMNVRIVERVIFGYGAPEHVIGMCAKNPIMALIEIDKTFWDNATDDDRRAVVYHELSHCYLDIGHSNDKSNYMYPSKNYVNFETLVTQTYLDAYAVCNAK